jgi:hypothetical protein
VAALPFFWKKKLGWKYVTMPLFCKHLGPFLAPEFRSADWEMRLYAELEEQLPHLAAFEQNFHAQVSNWLPFYWKGYRQTTLYTYTLDLGASVEALFQNVRKNYRNKIKAAEAKLRTRSDLPLQELHRLSEMAFERKGIGSPVPYSVLEKVWTALSAQGCGRMFFAEDRVSGELHAACLLAWDAQTAYLLMSGSDPRLRQSGAGVLLQWEAIMYAKNALNLSVFDFEGSMLPEVEQGRRDFGAKQQPYFRVRKEWSSWWKWGKALRDLRR